MNVLWQFKGRDTNPVTHVMKRVNNGITCHTDALFLNAFLSQVLCGARCGSKMKCGGQACYTSVEFFRKRTLYIIAAQPGLDMPKRNLSIKRTH